jgi:pyruvate/2-oxoglutarate dehydrogenase complex dihydrolipoamide dehydrogenase (E3) component
MRTLDADICVIGAGSGGLSVAAGAVQLGARTVLIEAGKMGGDCLNTGCVPSKSLIAAARVAQTMRTAGPFGIAPVEPQVDFARVRDHVHGVIAAIAPHDSVERFTKLGCEVILAHARFLDARTVAAGDARVRARRFVIATGSRAVLPPIPGLAETPHFTNESVFENAVRPEHLVIIGAGPVGCELAQAHRRLGSAVTVLDQATLLPKDDPELVAVVKARLEAEGVVFRLNVKVTQVARAGEGVVVSIAENGAAQQITGSHLLVAAGRKPNLDDLGLDAAGVATTKSGIAVDAGLRTTNRKIYAIGDVAGGHQLTHLANYHAGIVIRNALFRLPAKASTAALPWVTYTEPELAHVGMTEAEARASGARVEIARFTYRANDRAQAERATEGFIKVVAAKGRVLGASIVGAQAGEIIMPWVLAIQNRIKLGRMASLIAPYPILGEINKRVAGAFFTPKLFSERTRKLVRFLLRFG